MTSYVTPLKNVAFIMYLALPSQGNPNIFQASPTLAAGDFKVSIDGGALANLTTLPTVTPAAGKMVKISLSSTEMNGDNITVVCSDAAGAEWRDVVVNIQTSVRQIDDLAFPTVSGRSLDVSTGGEAGIDWANVGSPTTAVGLTGTNIGTSNLIRTATAQAGASTSITLDASASAVNNYYNATVLYILSGTGAGQARAISAYVGATKVATVTPAWATNPDSTSVFAILPAGYAYVFGLATGAITNSVFAAGAIDAAAIATDAIGAAELATDAVAEISSAIWNEATSGHTTAGTYGQALQVIRQATAQAGAAGTITLDASASAVDNFYNGAMVLLTGSTGAGQVRKIVSYVGSTKVATVQPNWTTNPSATSVFMILPDSHASLTANAVQSIWDALTSALTTVGSIGKLIVDNLNATISSRMATFTYTAPDNTTITAINAKTTNLPAAPAAVSDIPTASTVATAVLDAALTEPAATFTWAGATLRTVVAWMGALSRNKMTQTATATKLRNDADSADLSTSTISDDGTTFVRGEYS